MRSSTDRVDSNKYLAFRCLVAGICMLQLTACEQRMADQPRYDPLETSEFFSDGRSARPPVPGTVARGQLRIDEHLYTGMLQGSPVDTFPFQIMRKVLERGRERYDIFCSPCHDRVGNGRGMVVQRGFRPPPSFHTVRLRGVPVSHFIDAITRGFGIMPDYASQIPPKDRWAIVAYIRALQLSQHANLDDVPPKKRGELTEPAP